MIQELPVKDYIESFWTEGYAGQLLHIIKNILCFFLSPFRALHNCLCRKRSRRNLLPIVSERDKIKAFNKYLEKFDF